MLMNELEAGGINPPYMLSIMLFTKSIAIFGKPFDRKGQ
jgi:hypothetical protein